MRLRHSVRLPLSPGLALGLLAAGVALAAQQPTALGFASGRVSIAGTSNIHEYTASTTSVRVTRAQLGASVAGPGFWDEIVKPGAIEAFEIAIPAATLSSPKEGLDKNMRKALKVTEHPDITFRLKRLEPFGETPGAFRGIGVLQIAGVEREVAIEITTARKEAGLAVQGQLKLLMTDFGITPPKAMLGMLKTDPKVTVTFETLLNVPLT
jgi:hypothetical protein